jgi:hypothetical protein
MYTVFTVRGFVCILARPPPLATRNDWEARSSPHVTAGF